MKHDVAEIGGDEAQRQFFLPKDDSKSILFLRFSTHVSMHHHRYLRHCNTKFFVGYFGKNVTSSNVRVRAKSSNYISTQLLFGGGSNVECRRNNNNDDAIHSTTSQIKEAFLAREVQGRL